MRQHTVNFVNANVKKRDKIKNALKWFPLPFDPNIEKQEMDMKALKAFGERISRMKGTFVKSDRF